jgi:outer membrane protein assembly factor BamB
VTATEDAQTLFVVTLNGRLSAVDRTGRARWSLELGNRIYSSPLVLEDRVLFGTDQGQFLAVSNAGKVLWKFSTDGDADTSALRVGPLIVFAAGKRVYALDANGVVKWRYQARRKIFSSPALTSDQHIVFGAQDGHVVALSLAGAEVWRTDVGGHVDAAPAGGPDGAVYVGSDAHEVLKLDARGSIVWKCNIGGYVKGALTVARNGDVVAGTYGPNPRVVRISPEGVVVRSFAVRGTGSKDFGIHGSPIEDDQGRFGFGAQDDLVRVLSPTFEEEASFRTRGDVDAALTLLTDGTLLVPSEDGNLYAFAK